MTNQRQAINKMQENE